MPHVPHFHRLAPVDHDHDHDPDPGPDLDLDPTHDEAAEPEADDPGSDPGVVPDSTPHSPRALVQVQVQVQVQRHSETDPTLTCSTLTSALTWWMAVRMAPVLMTVWGHVMRLVCRECPTQTCPTRPRQMTGQHVW